MGTDGIAIVTLIGFVIVWVWSLVDVLKSEFVGNNSKIIWLLVILFLNILGSVLYLIIGRKQKK